MLRAALQKHQERGEHAVAEVEKEEREEGEEERGEEERAAVGMHPEAELRKRIPAISVSIIMIVVRRKDNATADGVAICSVTLTAKLTCAGHPHTLFFLCYLCC